MTTLRIESYDKDTRFRDKLNFRQLGGYVTTEGKSVKENVFYRSGAPFRMNESEIETLKQLDYVPLWTYVQTKKSYKDQIQSFQIS